MQSGCNQGNQAHHAYKGIQLQSESVLVVHFLGKAHHVPDLNDGAVVQDGLARHAAEHLVLVGDYELVVKAGGPVQNGHEVHLKPAVR